MDTYTTRELQKGRMRAIGIAGGAAGIAIALGILNVSPNRKTAETALATTAVVLFLGAFYYNSKMKKSVEINKKA